MINDNNRLIYKHEITVDIITLINSNIINDIVVVLLLFAFRYLWKEWGDSNFQIFFHRTASSTTGGWSCWNIFNVLDIYPSEHYGLSFFLDLTDAFKKIYI